MYQVAAVLYDAEIGFGEGEGSAYAIEECIESIDSIYQQERLIIDLYVISNTKVNNVPLGKIYRSNNNVFIVKKVATHSQYA
jgi:virulence-associated protein VapD